MKNALKQLIEHAIKTLQDEGTLQRHSLPDIQIDHTRERSHGDFACNIAMILAKSAGRNPRALAQLIVAALPPSNIVREVAIAGPGFINFFLASDIHSQVVATILTAQQQYGRSSIGNNRSLQVEFVSTNPTGPLHVGHGRGAAFGATIANLLAACGFKVQREYYVNDAGRQMDILASSVWLRYLGYCGESIPFPSNAYQGDYIHAIGRELYRRHGTALAADATTLTAALPPDEPQGGDKEHYIDALVAKTQNLLGPQNYASVFKLALDSILDDIRDDLDEYGVRFDRWFSERSLTASGAADTPSAVESAIIRLKDRDHLYEHDGALWFRSSRFGDEKDRVVRRDNGQTTYFASDIAYLIDKFERGFDEILYVWGADHHGYIARLKAAATALGYDAGRITILLVQFVNHLRHGKRVQMSTRDGRFVTLRELRAEVGNDAARFFYVMRKNEQHLDFDLELAKSATKDNPVYYIQYAHARICSVLDRLASQGGSFNADAGLQHLDRLDTEHEQILLSALSRYPEIIVTAATKYDPHLLVNYLRELANAFHSYYDKHKMLIDDQALRNARLALSLAVRQVIANGLALIGVSAPAQM